MGSLSKEIEMSRQVAIDSSAPGLTYLEQRIHVLEHQVAVLAEKVRALTPEADETEEGQPSPGTSQDADLNRGFPMPTKRWSVDIYITEIQGDTRAKALLSTGDRLSVSGSGTTRLSPSNRSVPEIGDEFAAARALIDLGHRLLELAGVDAAESTGEQLIPQRRVQAWDMV
jgi:Domain of unknown function (DUF1876)